MQELTKLAQMTAQDLSCEQMPYHMMIHGVSQEGCFEESQAQGIMQEGLKYSYMTTLRTTRELSVSSELQGKDLDYVYLQRENRTSLNVLLAVPEYLVSEGDVIPVLPQSLKPDHPEMDDGGELSFMDTVLDKNTDEQGRRVIPSEFVYGYYIMDSGSKDVEKFVLNPTHISKLPYEQRVAFIEKWKGLVSQAGYDYLLQLGHSCDPDTVKKAQICSTLFMDSPIAPYAVDKVQQIRKQLTSEHKQ